MMAGTRWVALGLAAFALTGTGTPGQVGGGPPVYELTEVFRGDEERDLLHPVAIAATTGGALVVADAHESRLLWFEVVDGAWTPVREARLASAPMDLTHDGDRLVLSLRGSEGLVVADEQLRLRSVALPGGTIAGRVAALPGGVILVQDLTDGEILRLSPDGSVRTLADPGVVFTALEGRPDGGFVAAVGERGTVVRYDATGQYVDEWNIPATGFEPAWPSDLVSLPGGRTAIVDRHGDRIVVIDDRGSPVGIGGRRGWEPGLFRFPAAAALRDNGDLAVVDQLNGRIQVFRWVEPEG